MQKQKFYNKLCGSNSGGRRRVFLKQSLLHILHTWYITSLSANRRCPSPTTALITQRKNLVLPACCIAYITPLSAKQLLPIAHCAHTKRHPTTALMPDDHKVYVDTISATRAITAVSNPLFFVHHAKKMPHKRTAHITSHYQLKVTIAIEGETCKISPTRHLQFRRIHSSREVKSSTQLYPQSSRTAKTAAKQNSSKPKQTHSSEPAKQNSSAAAALVSLAVTARPPFFTVGLYQHAFQKWAVFGRVLQQSPPRRLCAFGA